MKVLMDFVIGFLVGFGTVAIINGIRDKLRRSKLPWTLQE